MHIFIARSLAVIGVLSALLWAALPAVAVTCAMPGQAASGTSDCPSCCETGMLTGGGVVCTGCQAGGVTPRPSVGTTIAWLAPAAPGFVGIDLSPADPPPR